MQRRASLQNHPREENSRIRQVRGNRTVGSDRRQGGYKFLGRRVDSTTWSSLVFVRSTRVSAGGSEMGENREKNGGASLRPFKTRELNPDTCSKSWTRYGIVPTARRLGMTRKREIRPSGDMPDHEQVDAPSRNSFRAAQ